MHKSRLIKFIPSTFLFLFFLFLTTCLYPHNEERRDSLRKIRVGCEIDYPPYCFVNENGEADGFSVELFRAAANEMGVDVEFVTGPWNKLKYDLASGKLDALPLVGRTPEREEMYDFTFSYLKMHGTIVVRDDEKHIHSVEDLKGKDVVVMKGDNAEEFLRRTRLDANIIQRTTFKRALIELSEGEHDAVVIQRLTALNLMKKNGLNNLKLVGDPRNIFEQSFCFAVKEGDDELQSILNEGLALVNTSGRFRRLHAEWFAPIEAADIPKRRLIIGGDFNFPPYEFLDENGNPAGYNVDLIKAIAEEMGLKIEIQLGPWSEIRKELNQGHIDAIQGMLYSPERDKTFDFSPAHTNISYVIVTRKENELPENLKALKGKSVVVQDGDLMHDHVVQYNFTDQVIPVKSQEEALKELADGKYDYALASKILAHYYIEEYDWDNLKMSQKPVLSAEYALSVLNGNTTLLSKLSEGLAAIKSKGKYREIYSKWLGVYESKDIGFLDVIRYSLFFLIPLLMILAVILLWSYILRKRVLERTRALRAENIARKEAEKEIKKRNEEIAAQNEEYQTLNEELEEKNESLLKINNELRIAKEKAQESDQLKSAFIANISHEIRTPMNGIMGFADLLKKPKLEGEKKEEYIDLIKSSGERMLEIINNLLDLARVESGQMEINRSGTYVNDVLKEVVSLMEKQAYDKGLSINYRVGLSGENSYIITDPNLLNQILTNLVNNAIKYTDEGKIEIGYEKRNNLLQFNVSDTGIGIPSDYKDQIFERFRQADDTITRPYEGTGLGLSISKAFVNILGGEIWVDSIEGEGTTFYFTIPYETISDDEDAYDELPDIELKVPENLTVLVAEDDETSYLLVKETLGKKIKYIRATNGQEAIEMVKSYPDIDIILMDIKMPGMDGLEATREIKKMNPDIPIIAQTAFASKNDRRKAYEAGCDSYVSKPVQKSELILAINKLVGLQT